MASERGEEGRWPDREPERGEEGRWPDREPARGGEGRWPDREPARGEEGPPGLAEGEPEDRLRPDRDTETRP
jgi:hypothetical protein